MASLRCSRRKSTSGGNIVACLVVSRCHGGFCASTGAGQNCTTRLASHPQAGSRARQCSDKIDPGLDGLRRPRLNNVAFGSTTRNWRLQRCPKAFVVMPKPKDERVNLSNRKMTGRSKSAILFAALACMALAAQAQPAQPPRWVKADDLRVRAGPGLEHPVIGVLQRGSEVILKNRQAFDGYCLVEGEGQYGHVACTYLSAEPVPRLRAGRGEVPADRRWVVGTAVTLRVAPARDASVLTRLAINRNVQLLRADVGAGYCEVQPLQRSGGADGPSGYTACQYLAMEPVPVAQVAGVDPDPVRAFWRLPGWPPLEAYATALAAKLPDATAGPWPRDDTLERMKAHLALGLRGAPPPALSNWTELKKLAAAHDPSLLSKSGREQVRSGTDRDLQAREQRAAMAAHRLQTALGISGPLHDAISSDGGAERLVRLVRALELPSVRASFFANESELGPPGEGAMALSGRFGGIYRTLIEPRGGRRADLSLVGLYDMFSRTQVLTRPVQLVRLFRDGRLRAEETAARSTELLWRTADPPMCEGWIAGFSFGDAEGPIWRYFNESEGDDKAAGRAQRASRQRHPAGSLFAYHAPSPPPRLQAGRTEEVVKLDRTATGFIGVTQLSYDLDGDGVPDLLVLEHLGDGPGHLDAPAKTDDPWHRVLLANVGGEWKILGTDSFAYGCGC
jgi:hypothetical protein